MPTIQFKFPAGRYHATPIGHHVNEGQIEWPPSPWRILRALVAVGFTTQHWEEIPQIGRTLFEKLAAALPSYRIPDASAAHSRHYMPIGSLKNNRENTTLVFDTWANVGNGRLIVHWNCELDDGEKDLLQNLASCLNYLGRSESWVEAELLPDVDLNSSEFAFNAECHCEGHKVEPNQELVSLIAPQTSSEFNAWRNERLKPLLDEHPLPEGKKKPTQKLLNTRQAIEMPYPSDLLDCLMKDTAWWKQHRWSQPPGSRRVVYQRPANSLRVAAPKYDQSQPARPIHFFILSLTTPSGNKSALPRIERTLPQAELLYRSFVSRATKGTQDNCPELTGKDQSQNRLRSNHDHSHIIPVDLDDDGHIDHVIVFAKRGFGAVAQRAIRGVKKTWTKGGTGDLQVAIAGYCPWHEIPMLLSRHSPNLLRRLFSQQATTWSSVTPFVPPRFVKRTGKNSFDGQIFSELESRGLPAAEVTILPEESKAMRHFVRRRNQSRTPPPQDVGYAVRLQFDQPVCGPITLGYGSHYGLGLFEAID